MADQTVRIENMPDTSENSRQRVAYDLMEMIANAEYYERGSKSPEKAREYYLELYAACRKVVY